jgi:hypothetical protein
MPSLLKNPVAQWTGIQKSGITGQNISVAMARYSFRKLLFSIGVSYP